MSDELKLLIDVNLGTNGGRRLYQSIDELEEWFKEENTFWNWLRQTNWVAQLTPRYVNQFRQFGIEFDLVGRGSQMQIASLDQIGTAIKAFRTSPNISEGQISSFNKLVTSIYAPLNSEAPKAIHSGSLAGKTVDEIRQKDPALGVRALAFHLQVGLCIASSYDAEAICWSILYEQGLTRDAIAQKKALNDVFSEWTTRLADTKQKSNEELAAMSGLVSDERDKAIQRKSEFDKFIADSLAGVKKLVDESKAELTNIEKTYNEKLALQSSVTYWATKASKHTRLAWVFAGASVFLFAGGGTALYWTMKLVVGESKVSDVQIWKLGAVAIIATVVVWAIRVVARLLLSNLHLRDDAEERKTMLLTYLALLREGKLPEGDVQQLILQALFRPAATGIVKDDAAPPFMAQWLKITTGND